LLDIGVTKIAIIGAIALVVIGPDKLPGLAKTVGTLLGRARRYVADVKEEVNRSMELDELKKMRETVETAARDVENTIQTSSAEFKKNWSEATDLANESSLDSAYSYSPQYKHPKKNWRLKVAATPNWYKARTGTRSKAQSGAARVARFRPRKSSQ
jgi:sec-independent protein translocase protein TatB